MTQSYAAVKLEAYLLMHKGLQLLEEARGDAGQVSLCLMMRMMYNTSHISSNQTLRRVIQVCRNQYICHKPAALRVHLKTKVLHMRAWWNYIFLARTQLASYSLTDL